MTLGGYGRAATTVVMAATTTKSASHRPVSTGSRWSSRTATARTGPELADAADRHHAATEPSSEQVGVSQDRQQSAEGGGGERQPDHDGVEHRAERDQDQGGQQGQAQR